MAVSVGPSARGAIADINVTPMADVMIVLLIIFMVATPAIVGAPVRLPPALHAVDHRSERLDLVVRLSGEVVADQIVFSGADALAEWISARRASGAEAVVLVRPSSTCASTTWSGGSGRPSRPAAIRAAGDVSYERVVAAIDAAQGAGAARIGLVDDPPPESR